MLMHASLAYLNRAGNKRRTRASDDDRETLRVLNILLGLHSVPAPQCRWRPSVNKRDKVNRRQAEPSRDQRQAEPSRDQRQAKEESKAETVSKPGGFKNDPDDPTNPNEVRERFLRKLRR
jgi:hypothetical protein